MRKPKWVREHDEMMRGLKKQLREHMEPVYRKIIWNHYFEFEKKHPELKQRRLDYAASHPEWAKGREEYVFRD